eukprot:CAMPEP_0119321034 /NCGR_PEP_ID=MMETSP1333-20130426/54215_1 /TAXON_ID=418940 /ORGANISM="Scyphosphaera apsteinii, Strain RCC1455" /LENGTH=275 /DNA_ID=CAMNT_0007327897 /DNA_START=31 /DNA_END=858 /DNA_ORIENTATION=-
MQHIKFGGPQMAMNFAVLCGWGGSKLKNVSKYAELWHRIGWRTATIEMTMDMTFYPAYWTKVREVARIIANKCHAHRLSQGPTAKLVSHAFSNGGTFMQLSILEEGTGVRFDGAVYDSAPSRQIRFLPAAAPLVIASSNKPCDELLRDIRRHVPYALAATVASAFIDMPPPLGLFSKLFTPEGNAPRPELFVYGERDRMIPPSHVESFVRLRKSHGCHVHVLGPLKDSPHCEHGRTYSMEYEHAIERFARVVAAGQQASNANDQIQRTKPASLIP